MRPAIYFLAFALFLSAGTAGIGLAPERIHFSVRENSHAERNVMLYNLNGEESEFSVSALNNREFFEIAPQKGVIAGNGRQMIKIRLKPGLERGKYEEEFLAQIRNSQSGVSVIAGAKTKAYITVEPEVIYDAGMKRGPLITAGIVAIGLLIFKAFR